MPKSHMPVKTHSIVIHCVHEDSFYSYVLTGKHDSQYCLSQQ